MAESAAERMREMAAEYAGARADACRDMADSMPTERLRLEMVSESAAFRSAQFSIRALPLPADPRDGEIAALRRQLALMVWAWRTDTQWSGIEPQIVLDAVALAGDQAVHAVL